MHTDQYVSVIYKRELKLLKTFNDTKGSVAINTFLLVSIISYLNQ